MAVKLNANTPNTPQITTGPKYVEPRLVDYDGDLTKQWFIIYYIWNTDKNQKVRKRVLVHGKTANIRRATAKKDMDEILEYLKVGYTVGKVKQLPTGEINIHTITFCKAVEHAIEKKSQSIKNNTIKSYQTFRRVFTEWCNLKGYNNLLLKEATVGIVHEFFDYLKAVRKVENKTYNNYLGYLTTIFNWYIDREYLDRNPCNKVDKLPVESGGHTPYSNDQVKLIKEVIEKKKDFQLLLFIQCIYYTLIRPGELRMLKIGNILEKTIFIPKTIAKNRKGEHVLIAPALEKLIQVYNLRSYPKNYYIFGNKQEPSATMVGINYFYKRHRKILELIELTDQEYDLYGYKHTAVINLFNNGADLKDIQKQCRHATSQQTDQYLKHLGLFRNDNFINNFPEF